MQRYVSRFVRSLQRPWMSTLVQNQAAKTLRKEARLDPRLAKAFERLGMMDMAFANPFDPNASLEVNRNAVTNLEQGMGAFLQAKYDALPPVEGLEERIEVVQGVDGNEVKLYLYSPQDRDDSPLPCILHLHGGGLMMGSASTPNIQRFCRLLASRGIVVVAVDFRNTAGMLGPHPFPAGLNDCASGLQWVHDHQAQLNVSGTIIQGDSGGGNLALALALKAKQEAKLEQIQGIYSMCPMIYGDWANAASKNPELVSLEENVYMHSVPMLTTVANLYTDSKDLHNPLAWPFHATEDDLTGLPPVMISVNELDALRDEGVAFYRKVASAGNDCAARMVLGATHCEDTSDDHGGLHRATLRDIVAFAHEVVKR